MNNDFITQLDAEGSELAASLPKNRVLKRLLEGNIGWASYVKGFLCQVYHYTLKSSSWLGRSGARLAEQGRYPQVTAHLLKKEIEERNHHLWALNDAIAVGAPPDIVRWVQPSNAVRLYTRYNDFTTEEGSPLEILGTSYPLEYISANSARNVVENLIERSPIPGISSGVTFLLGHAAADVDHIEELRSVLRLIDDPADQRAILRAARMTAALFPLFFIRNTA